MTTPLGKSITRNMITGMEQPSQVYLLTEIGGSVKLLVDIANPFRTHKANRKYPNIQPTIVHSNQATGPGHSDQDYSSLGSLDGVRGNSPIF